MKNRLFHAEDFKVVQNRVLELINSRPTFLSDSIARSPRAVGDRFRLRTPILSRSIRVIRDDAGCLNCAR